MIDRFPMVCRWMLCGFAGILPLLAPAAESAPATTSSTSSAAATVPAPSFGIAPPAAWVRPVPLDLYAKAETAGDGMAFLLLDQQENVEPRAGYSHQAYRITSENGLQNGSAVSVSFDPAYQKLTFHFIRILRNGLTLERLKRPEVKVIQREREMEAFMYDGAFTAVCQLEDVRVDDVIEYTYTIEGANPVLGGQYFNSFSTDWTVPVQHAVARLVYPTARELHFQTKNRSIQTSITKQGESTEWLWEETNLPARHVDANTPHGYIPFGSVQITEFADWQQVANWAVPLYQVDTPPSPDLKVEIARIRMADSPEERVLAALRFVQEKIRYLGIEGGVGSHQPTAPTEVLRRRFGDCKDKTLLLGTILRQCEIQATPALVSTVLREHISERLPSPGGFDHVILHVELAGETYWLDATRSFQHGPLAQIYSSNFGYALLLQSGTHELTRCEPTPESMPFRKIVETYHIGRQNEECRLDAVSEYHGFAAEVARALFQTNSKEDIQKSYLQYFSRRYPHVRVASPLEFRELRDQNACEMTEHYAITDMWQISDDKTGYTLALQPGDLANEMGAVGAAQRTDPLAINHPVAITEEIHAELFRDWPVKPEQRSINNAFFHFALESKASGRHVELNYSYRTLKDQVPVANLAAYDGDLRKAKENLGYTFTYSTADQMALQKKENPAPQDQFNWSIALLLGVILAVAIVLAVRYYLASKLAMPLPPPTRHRDLDGIGGWLILVMIGQLFRPGVSLWNCIRVAPLVFRLSTWERLTVVGHPMYHPLWLPTLIFEMVFNALMVVLGILVLVLFFQKRAAWRPAFIVCFASLAIGVSVDHLLAMQIPAAAIHSGDSVQALVQAIVAAAVWIPYALTSRRVKYTFRH